MKNVLLILVLLFWANFSFAQPDRFTEYSQLVDKEVVLYDVQPLILSYGKIFFYQIDGKLKAYSPKATANLGDALNLKCIKLINVKKKQYLHCEHTLYGDLFLLIDSKKKNYIDKFRNITYWNEFINENKEKYAYIYDLSVSSNRILDRYTKVHWNNTELPLTTINDDAIFHYHTFKKNKKASKIITYSELLNENAFRSSDEYKQAEIEQHKIDSIQEIKDRKQDTIILAAECCVEKYTYGDTEHSYMSKGDTIFVYYASDSHIKGWYNYSNLKIENKYIKPLNNEQYKFLKYRGENNIQFRDSIAKVEAQKYAKRVLARIELEIKELEKKIEARNKEIRDKQLFFKDYDYVYGEYSDFGLKFEIHNCWKKTIKYIEFTTTAYNAVDDIQKDWVGKSTSKTKGIGPLEPGETATWSFDDMFYDKNDVIKRVKLTKITFIFSDGTTKTFSGNSNINKHRW